MATHDDVKYEHNYPALNLWLVLLKKTDAHHGLTAKQMCEEMERAFGSNPNHPNFKKPGARSIQNYLKYLRTHRILGTQLYKVDVKELKAQGITDYRPGTYITPIVDRGIATLLATMLRSSRLNSALVGEILDMLCNLAADDDVLPNLTKSEYNDVRQANVSMLGLVHDLTEAIGADLAVTFEYAKLDVFGELSYRNELDLHAITAPTLFVDPYAVVVKNDRFYLLGHLHNSAMPVGANVNDSTMGLQCYSLDRMRNVRIREDAVHIHMSDWDVNGASRHDTGLAPFDPITFTNERMHMVFGPLRSIQLQVSNNMLGQLFEDYGHMIEHTEPSHDSPTWTTVTLRAAEEDMRMWLLEHAARQGAFALEPRSLVQSIVTTTYRQVFHYRELLEHDREMAQS
ncbi:hypothetical protein BAAM0483_08145 [Bifidobacterium animalis subsp. animalis MCC 0483]|uniref:WYL domain-containing protein n=1 Tax=Bifidobacterium animalis subsp. animalis MCC 0483 TaxID=1365955 RepID=A0AB34T7Z9_9BIFI|nr:WYL domain-containing protein [Bifidobacterium animalis]KOA48446.1 hypothetical protein BAAM0483_08145 [Bifidobacterium animalis subsp. animalis MCC 0483]